MIDARPDEIEAITQILLQHVPDCEVRAYGSRAKWTANDYSDLDLVVVAQEKLEFTTLLNLRSEFEESNLRFSIDVMDWHAIPESFRQEIADKYVTIQRSSKNVDLAYTLIEFTPLNYGKALKKSSRESSGQIPVFGSGGIIGYHDTVLTKGPTVIVGRKGTVGSVYFSPGPCWPIDTTFYHEDPDSQIARFKYYTLSALGLEQMNSDSAVRGLNRDNAHSQQVRVPPIEEQRRISAILGALDDKIELNRRMNRSLEDIAQALFKSWFVDFEPVRAKAESLPTGLPPDLNALFPNRFVDSELGLIPDGWTNKSLDEIANFVNGLALQKYPPAGRESLPVIKIKQLRTGTTLGADRASASLDPKYVVQDGDILFSWSGSLECRLWTGGEGALNQHLFKVVPVGAPEWFCYLMLHNYLEDFRVIAEDKATTMGHIRRRHLSGAIQALPPKDILCQLDLMIRPLNEKVVQLGLEIVKLSELKEVLLPNLISGKIDLVSVRGSVDCLVEHQRGHI